MSHSHAWTATACSLARGMLQLAQRKCAADQSKSMGIFSEVSLYAAFSLSLFSDFLEMRQNQAPALPATQCLRVGVTALLLHSPPSCHVYSSAEAGSPTVFPTSTTQGKGLSALSCQQLGFCQPGLKNRRAGRMSSLASGTAVLRAAVNPWAPLKPFLLPRSTDFGQPAANDTKWLLRR